MYELPFQVWPCCDSNITILSSSGAKIGCTPSWNWCPPFAPYPRVGGGALLYCCRWNGVLLLLILVLLFILFILLESLYFPEWITRKTAKLHQFCDLECPPFFQQSLLGTYLLVQFTHEHGWGTLLLVCLYVCMYVREPMVVCMA